MCVGVVLLRRHSDDMVSRISSSMRVQPVTHHVEINKESAEGHLVKLTTEQIAMLVRIKHYAPNTGDVTELRRLGLVRRERVGGFWRYILTAAGETVLQ